MITISKNELKRIYQAVKPSVNRSDYSLRGLAHEFVHFEPVAGQLVAVATNGITLSMASVTACDRNVSMDIHNSVIEAAIKHSPRNENLLLDDGSIEHADGTVIGEPANITYFDWKRGFTAVAGSLDASQRTPAAMIRVDASYLCDVLRVASPLTAVNATVLDNKLTLNYEHSPISMQVQVDGADATGNIKTSIDASRVLAVVKGFEEIVTVELYQLGMVLRSKNTTALVMAMMKRNAVL